MTTNTPILLEDLVDNGEFDRREQGWRLSSGQIAFVEEEDQTVKNYFARIPQTDALFQDVPLIHGRTYIIEAVCRGIIGGTFSVKASGANDPTYAAADLPKGQGWGQFFHTFEVGSSWVRDLMIHFRAGSGVGRHLDLDKVVLYDPISGRRVRLLASR
jgi:hypothetical protein